MPGPENVEITAQSRERYDEILTPAALSLLATLQRELGPRRAGLLAARAASQQELIDGASLDFLPQTRDVRDDHASPVAPPAPGLVDRRVELTDPTDNKITLTALHSDAGRW